MSKIAHIRVSSIEQNTDRQEIHLESFGTYRLFIHFTEKITFKMPLATWAAPMGGAKNDRVKYFR